MATQRYSVTPHPIETILTWVKSGEIAIPEIQRPFVWDATKVRNLLDSLYQGYPVGYLIAWRNPTVRLKDGSLSAGKRILIDGQQRVTALMAALLGIEVMTKEYRTVRIRIGFHPVEQKFEVSNPAIQKDAAWIADIAELFAPTARLLQITKGYAKANPGVDEDALFANLERLKKIVNNHVGIIDLAEDLDIETVTEIFIRVNSAGASLSQADFAMSKIAANEKFGGSELRKAIDYFCHLSTAPDFHGRIKKGDPKFASSELFQRMSWLKDANDDIYDPSYTDMLRVAFTSGFSRGKLQDLVALLSGRNFETKQYEEAIAEASFAGLRTGIMTFMSQTHFERLVMILRSAGFVSKDLIGTQNAVNFAYILYLRGRAEKIAAPELEQCVRRWFVMSLLTGRYTGSAETAIDFDIREVDRRGVLAATKATVDGTLTDGFWSNELLSRLETSSPRSPYFLTFQAAQVKMKDKGFLSRDITVHDLILNRSDVHHLFPREHLKKQGHKARTYNQIANLALAQSEINIAIGHRAPSVYFGELLKQTDGGKLKHGGITDRSEFDCNPAEHCIPQDIFDGLSDDYDGFLEARRELMAAKMKRYFASL